MSIIKTQSSGARLNIYIPIKKLNIISWYFYVKNNVSNSAQIWLSYDFANIKDSNIQKMVEKGAIALNLSQPFDWKMISGNSLGFNIPKWATHFLIRINLDSTTTALKLYIDNLVCIEM
ncbi:MULTISPECIES: hypothetical protein [Clostridium]|uniref:Uncharacterized protein n=1 Tax=Clostridium lapidicellarium TaxID=3240931 RepID=A0ABV4E0Z7_9CLOT